MDGKRKSDVLDFVDWKERQADYPLPEDWWIQERQADLRAMQRRYQWDKLAVWGGTILFCAAAWALTIWLVLKSADWLDAL